LLWTLDRGLQVTLAVDCALMGSLMLQVGAIGSEYHERLSSHF